MSLGEYSVIVLLFRNILKQSDCYLVSRIKSAWSDRPEIIEDVAKDGRQYPEKI